MNFKLKSGFKLKSAHIFVAGDVSLELHGDQEAVEAGRTACVCVWVGGWVGGWVCVGVGGCVCVCVCVRNLCAELELQLEPSS
jgi:hypothetical protein